MSRYFHGECPEPKHAWLEAKLRAWVLKMGVELSGFTEAELRQVRPGAKPFCSNFV